MRADARRGEYLKASFFSSDTLWMLFFAICASVVAAVVLADMRILAAGPVVALLLILLAAYRGAGERSKADFFGELAPSLGLSYSLRGHYNGATPLLAAGDRRRFDHAMEGPLFGKLGGPRCLLAHYTFETRHEADDVTVWRPFPFTVCAIDTGAPLVRFRGLYLRPRLSGLGLEHDWLNRAPRPERVELESVRFNDIYEVRHTSDQDELAVRELFSPSFLVWLQEHPLRPGFECKAGTLTVFMRGHEESGGKITLLHDAAREIARRLEKQAHFSAAGQMIR